MLTNSAIGSYRVETIGDLIFPSPEPLPEKVAARIVATILHNRGAFGRLLNHVIATEQKGGVRG